MVSMALQAIGESEKPLKKRNSDLSGATLLKKRS
jgi:hypothetical protein